jgi:hypothetical protein
MQQEQKKDFFNFVEKNKINELIKFFEKEKQFDVNCFDDYGVKNFFFFKF